MLRFVLSGDIRQEEPASFNNNTFISAEFLLDRRRCRLELEKERGIEGIDASPLTIVIDGKQREKYAEKECLERLSTAYEGQLLVVLEEPQEGMYRKKPGTEVSLNQEQDISVAGEAAEEDELIFLSRKERITWEKSLK